MLDGWIYVHVVGREVGDKRLPSVGELALWLHSLFWCLLLESSLGKITFESAVCIGDIRAKHDMIEVRLRVRVFHSMQLQLRLCLRQNCGDKHGSIALPGAVEDEYSERLDIGLLERCVGVHKPLYAAFQTIGGMRAVEEPGEVLRGRIAVSLASTRPSFVLQTLLQD